MILPSLVLAAGQLITPQQADPLPASPVARIEVTPRPREITAGDSVRLSVRALDAQGKPVRNATIRYALRSGWGEAEIDSTGLLVASSVGKPVVTITALVPGSAPKIETVDLRTVPAAPARIEVPVKALKLVVGPVTYTHQTLPTICSE